MMYDNIRYAEEHDTAVEALTGSYLKTLKQYDVLDEKEERALLEKYAKTKDKEAYEKLFLHNQKLVVSIAKNYVKGRRTLELMDLIQEGCIGLDTAIKKFDCNNDNKFSTYAVWWIRQSILRYISNNDEMIRVPVHAQEKYLAAGRIINEKEKELQRSLTDDEKRSITDKIFADTVRTGDTLGYYNELLCLKSGTSLNTPLSTEDSDGENELADFITDDSSVEDEYIKNTKCIDIRTALNNSSLSDKEKNVIKRRLGFDTGRRETLEEIGNEMGVTRERVRQIETLAMKKLRRSRKFKELKDYLV